MHLLTSAIFKWCSELQMNSDCKDTEFLWNLTSSCKRKIINRIHPYYNSQTRIYIIDILVCSIVSPTLVQTVCNQTSRRFVRNHVVLTSKVSMSLFYLYFLNKTKKLCWYLLTFLKILSSLLWLLIWRE